MNKIYLSGALIVFALIAYFTLQQPYVPPVPSSEGENISSSLPAGITNVRTFGDGKGPVPGTVAYIGTKKMTNGAYAIPSATPKPLPYPRVAISYSLQTTNSIRGIGAGRTKSFILVSVDIRNFGYKYFDADPRKFRLGSLEPILNVSTGNLLDAVIPNNSETQGDLIFLTGKTLGGYGRLSYISGDYEIIYGTITASSPPINVARDFSDE
jgi:hypothetical protein